MKPEKSDKDKVIAGGTKSLATDKSKKLRLYGLLLTIVIVGAVGVYTLVFSKALCMPAQIINGTCEIIAPIGSAELTSGQTLSTGSSLVAGGYLTTPTTPAYRLTLQNDGNLVVYSPSPNRHATWSTRTNGTGSSNRLVLQTDGNLVLYTADNRAVWNSVTFGSGATKFVMQNDGNAVLYTADNTAVWSSVTGRLKNSGPAPVTNTLGGVRSLAPGQSLAVGQNLVNGVSLSNYYRLVMQADGNLVVYNTAGKALWSTRTNGTGSNNRMVFQADGNLVVYTTDNRAVWNSVTFGSGANQLVMQTDGNLVLYTASNKAVWSSVTGKLR